MKHLRQQKEKDAVRISSNSTPTPSTTSTSKPSSTTNKPTPKSTVPTAASIIANSSKGYEHDIKDTLLAAAKALGMRIKKGKNVGGVAGVKSSVKTTLGPSQAKKEEEKKVDVLKQVQKKRYVTEGRVDYVSLMNSGNPKKLAAKTAMRKLKRLG
ncbi:hypothetical protein HDV05_003922 [Chytridiales sp. JEL 0842]|nr:hypothetical protein HDV05_003922 [Chytridiales sp. JEL 0842]